MSPRLSGTFWFIIVLGGGGHGSWWGISKRCCELIYWKQCCRSLQQLPKGLHVIW
jgi:hypothetical protein